MKGKGAAQASNHGPPQKVAVKVLGEVEGRPDGEITGGVVGSGGRVEEAQRWRKQEGRERRHFCPAREVALTQVHRIEILCSRF